MKKSAAVPPAFSSAQISATVPPPIATPAEPRKAAKNRHTRSEAKLLEAPAPAVKAKKEVQVPMYTKRRPRVSDSGAMNNGPTAIPSVYSVSGNTAAVRETWNASWSSGTAGTVTEVAKVLFSSISVVEVWWIPHISKASKEGNAVWNSLLGMLHI